ncbi:MAG: hypothetical protein AB8G86_05635 [Saprospiraceae bacterium]
MTKLLFKNFLRSKGLLFGLLLLFVSGLVSLHIGKIFLAQQASIEEKTVEFQKENHQQHLDYQHGEMGLLLYYIRFGIVNETPALAGLSIGHRDIQASVKTVNIRNLEEQKHSTKLLNPFYQLLGNMDFSFVLIYLFPLIIIGLCFNLLSEEKEGGTWRLILSQSDNPLRVLRTKLFLRLGSVLAILWLLLVIGKIYLSIPLDTAFAAFGLMATVFNFLVCPCMVGSEFAKNICTKCFIDALFLGGFDHLDSRICQCFGCQFIPRPRGIQ